MLVQEQHGFISIITPTYNRTTYLLQAVESVLCQTYLHFELIISDDASTEDVEAALKQFQDPRIRYRRNPQCLGQFANTIAGLQAARGEFFSFLHDDDRWEPTFLEKVVPPLLSNPNITVSFSDHYVMDEIGQVDLETTQRLSRKYKRVGLAEGIHQPFYSLVANLSIPAAMASVFRGSILENEDIPPQIDLALDRYLAYLASRNGKAAYYTPERLTYYRVHPNSCTAASFKSFETARERYFSHVYYYDCLLADPAFSPYAAQLRQRKSVAQRVFANFSFKNGLGKQARSLYLQSLRTYRNFKSFAGLMLTMLPGSQRLLVAHRR